MVAKVYMDLAMKIDKLYNERFPAAKRLMTDISENAQSKGEIRTILNRRVPFDLWWSKNRMSNRVGLPYGQALRQYGSGIVRADTYKGLNYTLQGSAADLIKKGMVDAYESGIFDKIGVPHIQVHDELGFSYHADLHKQFRELIEIMENAIKLRVPVIMDAEIGPNWGNCHEKLGK